MYASRSTELQPMLEMNTTPLVDVMLVLLVMFIITIPAATHSVRVDLPIGPGIVNPIKNKVVITESNRILWNGTPATSQELQAYVAASMRLHPQPELQLQPEADARYEIVDQVLAITKRAQVTRMGFVGNEQHRNF
ncbi:MAG: biopolymer transporter ExbD [Sphingomicrobium sp.]